MINIAQTNPAVWSPPASTATAPVAAVAAVRPVQDSARSGQPGTSPEPNAPSARAERRASVPERPERKVPADGARGSAGRAGSGEPSDLQARREAEQNAKQQAAEQAAEEARRAQRQELLTNVWKASAAVVDRALGQDDTSAVDAAAPSLAPADSEPSMEQLALPWPVMPQDADAAPSRADLGASEEVVAYDEHGNGSVAPLEAGMLISHHV